MSNPSKAKGSLFERQVCEYLSTHGLPYAERRALRGINDGGDICGVVGWSLEAKACKGFTPGEWMDEATRQAANARAPRYAFIAKRRRRPIADAFVVMPLSVFAELVGDEVTA